MIASGDDGLDDEALAAKLKQQAQEVSYSAVSLVFYSTNPISMLFVHLELHVNY